jgi:ADP-ribose pyrophosphatase
MKSNEQQIIKIKKITNNKWINLFRVQYINSKEKLCDWIFASRKSKPYEDSTLDAVVIAAIVKDGNKNKLLLTKEFRAPINDYEYGFPAGLIEKGHTVEFTAKKELKEETGLEVKKIIGRSNIIISSAGLSDESVIIVLVEAEGTLSDKFQEKIEDIEAFLYDINDIQKLLNSDKKIGAKAWGMLYYYSKMGKIE